MSNSVTPKSPKSPKNKYRIELNSKKPIKGIGSSFSFGVMTLEGVKCSPFYKHYETMLVNNGGGYVSIKENKKIYPNFAWETIENFEI